MRFSQHAKQGGIKDNTRIVRVYGASRIFFAATPALVTTTLVDMEAIVVAMPIAHIV
jgi:hypothetical protein